MYHPEQDYTFDLMKSVNQSDLFYIVAEDIKEFQYQDFDVRLKNPNISYFYKVRVTHKETGEQVTSAPKRFLYVKGDQYAAAITETYRKYLFDVINNPEVILLQKKWTGNRCECQNPNRGESDRMDCPICFGVGFTGGYFRSQIIRVNYYNPPALTREFNYRSDADRQNDLQFWTENFPIIRNEDLVIDGANRYIAHPTSHTHKNHSMLRQIVTIAKLPESNIAYSINVDGAINSERSGDKWKDFQGLRSNRRKSLT